MFCASFTQYELFVIFARSIQIYCENSPFHSSDQLFRVNKNNATLCFKLFCFFLFCLFVCLFLNLSQWTETEECLNLGGLLHCPVYWALPACGKEDVVSPKQTSSSSKADHGDRFIPEWWAEFFWNSTNMMAVTFVVISKPGHRGLPWTVTKAGQRPFISEMTWGVNSVALSLRSIAGEPRWGRIYNHELCCNFWWS